MMRMILGGPGFFSVGFGEQLTRARMRRKRGILGMM